MIKLIYIIFGFTLVGINTIVAQEILTEQALLSLVKNNHPFIKQAEIEGQIGELNLRKARGNFDPYLYAETYRKSFDQKNYYEYNDAQLIIPTRLAGISFSGGYELNQGDFINPEFNTPQNGLLHAGVNIPIGRGLWTDLARTELAQAQAGVELAEATRIKIINKVLLDAGLLYWDWVEAASKQQMYEENAELLWARLQLVKDAYFNGERPAVDTLEAYIQWQNFDIAAKQEQISNTQKFQKLMNYAWVNENNAYQKNAVPKWEDIDVADDFDLSIQWANHPEIQAWQQKIQQQRYEQRWKREQLKPKLDLKYNFLQTMGADFQADASYFRNNYQFGVSFAFPLLLRKERNDLKITNLKLEQLELSREQSLNMLQNEDISYTEMLQTLKQQLDVLNNNVQNYSRLLQIERRKFDIGESSVFLINAREVSLMDARIKQLKTLSLIKKTEKLYLWNLGVLHEIE